MYVIINTLYSHRLRFPTKHPANLFVAVQVAFPHCATCFGRCYLGGASLITDSKGLYDGIARLVSASTSRNLPKPVNNLENKNATENGDAPPAENGIMANGEEQIESPGTDEKEENNTRPQTERPADDGATNA